MSVDTNKDLIKLYHHSGQQPKSMATSLEITVDALYQLGVPAGTFSKVNSLYNYNLPTGITVIGSDGGYYKLKSSGSAIDPVTDTYDATTGLGSRWVKIGTCCAC